MTEYLWHDNVQILTGSGFYCSALLLLLLLDLLMLVFNTEKFGIK